MSIKTNCSPFVRSSTFSKSLAFVVSGLFSVPALAEQRSIDGTGNNFGGQSHSQLRRDNFNGYSDLVSSPAGVDVSSPRAISNAVCAQSDSQPNARGATDMLWLWGQFLDHDIDLTEAASPSEPLPIDVPTGDPDFDPASTGTQSIAFNRSEWDPGTGTDASNPRQQLNQITAFIDASNVYGADEARALALREGTGGRLLTSPGDYMPYNVDGWPNAGGSSPDLFFAGDVRANEHVGLTAMHTLFVREHNQKAAELAFSDPGLDDEELYQQARAWVGALIQVVTYSEFLPMLLGENALTPYSGHDPGLDVGIHTAFSTMAYRLGHSMINHQVLRLDASGQEVSDGHLELRHAFFSPEEISDDPGHGIDALLRGFASQQAQEIDTQIIDDLRNFLFGAPGAGGFDLASLNIQRGRDHGLPRYAEIRALLNLPPVSQMSDVSSDPDTLAGLSSVYANVAEVDPWVGGLAETHVPGAMVGPTFHTLLVDQFQRLRDGDVFWYQLTFSGSELSELESTTLADIIERNTAIAAGELNGSVFSVPGLEALTLEVCDGEPDRISVPEPDSAAIPANASITGQLVAHGGQTLASPTDIDFVDGNLLAVGNYTVEWTITPSGATPFTLSQAIEVEASSDNAVCCPESGQTTQGSNAADFIYRASSSNQQVRASGGADFVMTGSGNDCILGQSGADSLHGQGGSDRIRGGIGDDAMHCTLGDTFRAWGGPGNDYIAGQTCDDGVIFGGPGDDNIVGTSGDDLIHAGTGRDAVEAGSGNDEVIIAALCEIEAGSYFAGGSGQDLLVSPVSLATLQAAGATITGFEQIIVDDRYRHLADCS